MCEINWEAALHNEIYILFELEQEAIVSFTKDIIDINSTIFQQAKRLAYYHDYIQTMGGETGPLREEYLKSNAEYYKLQEDLKNPDLIINITQIYNKHTAILQQII